MDRQQQIEDTARYYDHAKNLPYTPLINRWESFRETLGRTTEECLRYTQNMETVLRNKINLPARSQSGREQPPWVSYEMLTIFIFEKQVGITDAHVYTTPAASDNLIEARIYGPQDVVMIGISPTIDAALKVVDEVTRGTTDVVRLKKLFADLRPEADALVKDFREALTQKSLPAPCDLV